MPYTYQLHTHTYRCGHADGDVADYVQHAKSASIAVLGMSDHLPFPDGRWSNVRMHWDLVEDYCAAVHRAAADTQDMGVLLGFEVEWDPALASWYEDELLGRLGAVYLIGAGHYRPDGSSWAGDWPSAYQRLDEPAACGRYTAYMLDMMERAPIDFIAHADLIGCSYDGKAWDANAEGHARAICSAAADKGIPLEMNAYGLRKPWCLDESGEQRPRYPWFPFWEIAAEYGCTIVRSSDAHRPQDVAHGYDELGIWADKLGLQDARFDFVDAAQPTRPDL
jgi:histidinol-phosphatase (PHP family)